MARNSSGTHSLVAGNPVVTGTTIDSSWANTTMDDLSDEITDSLSRSGKGGMTAPLRGTDGTDAAPAISFTSETGTGWYRSAAKVMRGVIFGTWRLLLKETGVEVNGTLNSSGKIIGSAGLDVTGQVAVVDDGGTSKKVTFDAPTGLAADYALTLPTALPGSTLPVTLTSAGVLSTGQIVNAQQNFGTPSANTDVVIKSYTADTVDTPTGGTNVVLTSFKVVRTFTGRVMMAGRITFGATTFTTGTFCTLTSTFRPAALQRIPCVFVQAASGFSGLALVAIDTDGTIKFDAAWRLFNGTPTTFLPTAANDYVTIMAQYDPA